MKMYSSERRSQLDATTDEHGKEVDRRGVDGLGALSGSVRKGEICPAFKNNEQDKPHKE